jgi:hypothetical protein
VTKSLAVGRIDQAPTVAVLMADYTQYVRDEHALCRSCPVVRSGVPLVGEMLEWKATRADGGLEHWTRQDVRDYLLGHLPTANVSRALLGDAPTCAKDLVYFLADRGTLVGDDVSVLADATDEIVYRFGRVATLVDQRPTPRPTEHRRARRKAARAARKRNR